jgi:hypothetical protein
MRLDVADAFCLDLCHGLRRPDYPGLALNARRGIANLGRSIIINSGAPDDGMHVVTIGQCIFKPLQ